MRDPETFTVDDPRFTTGRVVGPSMLSRDGAEHGRHRAPFAAPFRLAPVRERFADHVASTVDELLDGIAPRGRGELRADLAAPLAASIAAHALGLDAVPIARVLEWYDALVAAVTTASAGSPLPASGLAGFEALRAAILPELERDPLSSLVAAAAAQGSGLSPGEVVSNAAVLLFGGIETTEGMLATVLMHLLTEPGALAAVRADRTLLAGALEESLRLEPAAATVDRYATRDVQFGGAPIARGDLVIVSIAAANRDPAVFSQPDRFELGRPDARRHVTFAAGPHTCIGMHLARLEAHEAVGQVLDRLTGLRLDPAQPAPAARGLVFRKPPAVHAVWDP
jgi:hypothetical protein